MKLAVITDEISQDFEHALDVMLEYDVRYAELRGLWGTNIADLDEAQVLRAKEAMRERGITVCCLSTPIFKCDLDRDSATVEGPMHLAKARGIGDQAELLRRCAALGREFGVDLIRVFSFWRKGILTPQVEDRIVDAFADILVVAEEEGVTLLLENEHACFIGTGAEAARILSAVDSSRLKACWDPGNAHIAGETPFPDGYDEISPFLKHVHIKDGVINPADGAHRWSVVGEGDIDYNGQFDALRSIGYQGFISLETHYVPEGGTPEDGSRACLTALRRFIKD